MAINTLLLLDLYLSYVRELLRTCFWKITEADGKHKVCYWPEGALSAYANDLELVSCLF